MQSSSGSTIAAIVLATFLVGGTAIAALPSFYDLRVDRIEVTQGIQTEDNAILLIDARPTTIRVYIDFSPSAFAALSNVEARLRIYDGANLLYSGYAYNGPATVPQAIDRQNEDHTLNFDWVPELNLFGTDTRDIRFEVLVDPGNKIREFDETNNTFELTLPFACRQGPDIAYLPIDYQYENADPGETGTPEERLIEPGTGDAFVWGIYPFSQGIRGDRGRYRESDLEALEWDRDVDVSFRDLLDEVARQRLATSPTPDYLYAWQRGNPYSGNGRGELPGRAAFGNTDTTRHQRTFAHELGHNQDFVHTSATTGEVGWDVGDRLGLGPVKRPDLNDIMVGGQLTDTAWIDPSRYEDVYNDPTWECRDPFPQDILELLEIPVLEIPGGWTVGPILHLYARRPEIVRREEGRGVLDLLDAEGGILYRQFFDPLPPGSDSREGESSGATVVTPNVAAAQAMEVRIDGELVERRDRSPNPPEVNILSPAQGESVGEGTEIVWEMRDRDEEPIHAFVRFSPDGESRWIPLGARTTGTSLRLRPGNLPSTDGGVIEVRVTDGFNTTVETVGALRLGPDRAPRVHILRPVDGAELASDAVLTLIGDAVDPEDGTIDDGMQWFSSLDGFLGEGPRVEVAEGLNRGTHVIDLIATDSSGGEAGDSIRVHVGTLATGPSPGEASDPTSQANAMRVTGYDPVTGAISVSYSPACGATGHSMHAGPLVAVGTYGYDQTVCGLGTDGTATFTPAGDSVFFVLVGEDGRNEGSHGTDGDGNERPERIGGGACDYPQALDARCD